MQQLTSALHSIGYPNKLTHQQNSFCACRKLTRACIGLATLIVLSFATLCVMNSPLSAAPLTNTFVDKLGERSSIRSATIVEGSSIAIRINFNGTFHTRTSELKFRVDDPGGFLKTGQSGEKTQSLAARNLGYTFMLDTKRKSDAIDRTITVTGITNDDFDFEAHFGVFTINVAKFPEVSIGSFESRDQEHSVTEGHPIRILVDSESVAGADVFLLVTESTNGGDHIESMHEGRRLVELTSQTKSFDIPTMIDSNSSVNSTVTITVLPTSLYDINHSRSTITVTVKDTEVPKISIISRDTSIKDGHEARLLIRSSLVLPIAFSITISLSEDVSGILKDGSEKVVMIPANEQIEAFVIETNEGKRGEIVVSIKDSDSNSYTKGTESSVTIAVTSSTLIFSQYFAGDEAMPSSRGEIITEGDTIYVSIEYSGSISETRMFRILITETPIGVSWFKDEHGGQSHLVGANHLTDTLEGIQTISGTGGTANAQYETDIDYSSNLKSVIQIYLLGGSDYRPIDSAWGSFIVENKADIPVLTIATGASVTKGNSADFAIFTSETPSAGKSYMVNYSYTINGVETDDQSTMVTIGTTPPLGPLSIPTSATESGNNDIIVTATLKTGTGYVPKYHGMTATIRIRASTTPKPLVFIEPKGANTITEGGTAMFAVKASSAPVAGSPVIVNINVTGAESFISAGQGGMQTVEINDMNHASGEGGTLMVRTDEDTEGEFDATIIATIASGTTYNIDTTSQTAVVNVLDDDLPVISIMSPAESVDEGETISFMLTASKFLPNDLSVKLMVDGLAGILGDNAGEKIATFRSDDNDLNFTFSIDTETDRVYEGDNTITVTILDEDPATATYIKHSSDNVATATIREIDPPSVTISAKSSPIARGSNPEFVLTLAVPVDDPIMIGVMISSETSNIFVANQLETRNIPVASGITELSFEVLLVANLPSGQNDQIIKVQAELQTGTGYTLREDVQPAIVAVINPNDTSNFVEISISTTSNGPATEGDIITLTLSSKRNNAAANPTFPITILVQLTGADSFLNENQQKDLRVAITPESTTPEATIEIKTVNDSRHEPGAVLTATVIQSLGYNISPTEGSVSVVIINNPEDIPLFTISPPNNITEGQMAIFDITSDVSVSTPLPINFRIEFDGNVQTWRRPSEIIFPANANTYTLSIPTFNDGNPQSASGSIRLVLLEGEIYQLSDVQTEYDATIEVQNNRVTNNEPRISVADVAVDSIIEHLSMNQAEGIAPVTPVISISAMETVINEGEIARFMIMTSAQTSRQLSIQVNTLPVGEFEVLSLTNSIDLPSELQITMLELPTVKNPRATSDGNITVQIAPGVGYLVSEHPSDSATITVSDAEDRNALHQQIDLANREVLPVQLRSIATNSMNVVTNRFELLGSNLKTSTIQLNGRDSIPDMLTNTGDSINQESFNLNYLLQDSNFNYELVSSDESFGSISVWGLSKSGELSPDSNAEYQDWDGEALYGQLGFDTRLQNGVVGGLATTLKQTRLELESNVDNTLNYETNMTGLLPYLGWNSQDQADSLQLYAEFGQGEIAVNQGEHRYDTFDTNYAVYGVSSIKNLYSSASNSQFGESKLNFVSEAWQASQLIESGNKYVKNSELDVGAFRVAVEGAHQIQIAKRTLVNPQLAIGFRADDFDQNRNFGLDSIGSINLQSSSINVATSGQYLIPAQNEVPGKNKWFLTSYLKYDSENNDKGLLFEISRSWGDSSDVQNNQFWSNNLTHLGETEYPNRSENGFYTETGFGFEVLDGIGILTPFGNIELNDGPNDKFSIGSRFSTLTNLNLELVGTRRSDNQNGLDQRIELKSHIQW